MCTTLEEPVAAASGIWLAAAARVDTTRRAAADVVGVALALAAQSVIAGAATAQQTARVHIRENNCGVWRVLTGRGWFGQFCIIRLSLSC